MSENEFGPAGIVYVVINEAMEGYVKIGKTAKDLEQRLRELDNTSVPLPFECVYAAKVANMDLVERKLHDTFDDYRTRSKREFFAVDPERVIAALGLAEHDDVTPKEEDIVEEEDDLIALHKARKKRERFSFSLLSITHGAVLHLKQPQSAENRDEDVTCIVAGNNKVNFGGEEMSLSTAARRALEKKGVKWSSYGGPDHWTYEGETLGDRRRRMEEND